MNKAAAQHKSSSPYKKNTLEKDKFEAQGGDVNIFDQLLKKKPRTESAEKSIDKPLSGFRRQRTEFTIFAHSTYQETDLIPRQIESLKEEIRREVAAIKQSNKTLLQEVIEIEKATLETTTEKSGIYHVRFLEVLLSLLSNLRAKVTEAKTWLSAMQTKKKKRGSLFAARSKSKGTQYSMSQELQNTRSVQ